MNGDNNVTDIEDSYLALGNDGLHFDTAINDGENLSVPRDVLDALYCVSDHLPVLMKVYID